MIKIALGVFLFLEVAAGTAHAQWNTLGPDEYLFLGQNLTSDCHYRLNMKGNGNLELVDWGGRVFWSVNTGGRGVYTVMQKSDGNLVIYDIRNQPIWNAVTWGHPGAYAILQGDRNFVVYDDPHSEPGADALWNTQTWDNGVGVSIQPCNWSAEKTTVRKNYDLPGGDYDSIVMIVPTTVPAATPEVCGAACATDDECVAFTFVPAGVQGPNPVCYRKNFLAGDWVAHYGMVSGIITGASHNGGNL